MTSPIVCRLDVLDTAQRARQLACHRAIRAATRETKELPDGYALNLGSDLDTFRAAAEWIPLERRCCSFLAFTLEAREDDSVWLSVTGREGVKAFVGDVLLERLPD